MNALVRHLQNSLSNQHLPPWLPVSKTPQITLMKLKEWNTSCIMHHSIEYGIHVTLAKILASELVYALVCTI